MHRQHLCSQANSQKRPLFPERNRDPVDLPAHVIVGVVGTHWPAEDDRAGMALQRFRKRIAKTGAADVELAAERQQDVADAARARAFLMQDDQNR